MATGSSYDFGAVPITAEASGLAHVPPAAVSWGPDRLDVFAVSNPRHLLGPRELIHARWEADPTRPDEHSWSLRANPTAWQTRVLGGRLWDVRPAALATEPGKLDVFAPDDQGVMQHWRWRRSSSSTWDRLPLPGPSVRNGSGPTAVSWGPGRIDLFAIIGDGSLEHWWTEGGIRWRNENLGGRLAAADPAAVSWAPGRLDVVAIAEGGRLVHWWFSQGIQPFARDPETLEMPARGHGVAVAAWGSGRLDVVDAALQHLWFDRGWGHPELGDGTFEPASSPALVHQGPGKLWAFGVAAVDGVLGPRRLAVVSYDASRRPEPWQSTHEDAWLSVGGVAAVASRGGGRVDAFAVSDSNLVSGPTDQLQYFWIDPAYNPPNLVIETTSPLPPVITDTEYRHQLTVRGVPAGATVTWRVARASLPPGLTLTGSGLLTGTVPSARWGTANRQLAITVSVEAGYPPGQANKELRMHVLAPTPNDTRTHLVLVLHNPAELLISPWVRVQAPGLIDRVDLHPTEPFDSPGYLQRFEAALPAASGNAGRWLFQYELHGIPPSDIWSTDWYAGRLEVHVTVHPPDLRERTTAYFMFDRFITHRS